MNRGRYKKSNRRKRKIRNIIIISIAAATALFIMFLAVGLSLSEKTKKDKLNEKSNAVSENEDEDVSKRKVKDVCAYPLPLLEDGSSFSSRLAGIKDGASSVCVSLNRPDGTLLYRSDIASKFSYLTVEKDASKLSTYVNQIEEDELYATATLYIPTFTETEDDLEADVELSIWGAIACEAIRGGIDDVLLIADGADADDVEKLCALAERIHITEEKAIIGVCLTNEIFEDEKSVTLTDTLSKAFDYLAFDATSLEGDGAPAENLEAAIKEIQHQLLYHKMRILLPRGANAEELETLADTVTKHAISSWQALPH